MQARTNTESLTIPYDTIRHTIEEFILDLEAECGQLNLALVAEIKQESPAIADKPARR